MNRRVFDSSAILAIVNQEPGADLVRRLVPDGLISAVNAAEVYTKFSEYGPEAISVALELLDIVEIVPFNAEQARRTGDLRASTRKAGLSLGDRACLALGMELDAEVLTTETVWPNLACRVRFDLFARRPNPCDRATCASKANGIHLRRAGFAT